MKHTFLGISTVANDWRNAYNSCKIGDNFSKVTSIAGEPDEVINLGDVILYTYESREWKGWARGGTIIRKMQFSVKQGIIISKFQQNLDRYSF